MHTRSKRARRLSRRSTVAWPSLVPQIPNAQITRDRIGGGACDAGRDRRRQHHRGAIFSLGLLCAAAGATWSETPRPECYWRAKVLGPTVRQRWGQAIMRGPIPLHSHGTNALRRFGAVGARAQAAAGFPNAIEVGLPALQLGRRLVPEDPEAARVRAFSQSWRRWRTPICFTAAVPLACIMRRKRRPVFSHWAVSAGSVARASRGGASSLRCASP